MDEALVKHHTQRAFYRMVVPADDWDDWYQEARMMAWILEQQGHKGGILATALKCDLIDAYRKINGRKPGQRPSFIKGFGEIASTPDEPMRTFGEFLAETLGDTEPGPAEIAEADDDDAYQRRVLRRLWPKLDRRDRQVVARRAQGKCWRVIGKEIGISESATYQRFKRVCRDARAEMRIAPAGGLSQEA